MQGAQRFRGALLAGAATLVLGGAFFPAAAADLGGNCCADLEERIAELEATTARKGNRKVSLTISGWVNEQIAWWDDGSRSNVYVGTNAVEQSRVRFVGEAKINADWSAGYILELGISDNPGNQYDQNGDVSSNPNPANQSAVIIRKSNWFLKNKNWGQVAVGLNGTATYHLLDDADPTLTRNVDDAEGAAIFLGRFFLRSGGAPVVSGANTLRWSDALRGFNNATPGDSARRNVVRYDSPTIQGFTFTAAWGEDDLWDTALTYKNDFGDFSVLARVGYGESNDSGTQNTSPANYVVGGTPCISSTTKTPGHFECSWEAAGATVIHKPTGLFLYGGWGRQHVVATGANNPVDPDSTVWFLQPGIEYKWLSLGKTNIFGEYRQDDPGSNPGRTVGGQIRSWQGGIIQNIEAADMSLYLVYQHTDGEVNTAAAPATTVSLDAFQTVIGGAKINF
jgi:hypothetical protein